VIASDECYSEIYTPGKRPHRAIFQLSNLPWLRDVITYTSCKYCCMV